MSSLFQMKRTMLVVFSLFLLLTSALWAQFPQGFEGGAIPTDWTVYNVDGDTKEFIAYNAGTAAQEGSWVAQVSWNADGNNDWLVTPQINVTAENKVVKFWARSTSTTWFEDFNIKLSTTGNAVADFTVNVASYLQIANAWTEYTVDLTSYVGTSVYLGIQVVSLNELTFRIDGFDWVLGDDLAALSITGSNSPTVGTANDYVVTVKNNGGNAQSTYSVKFYVNDAEVATLPGTQIAAGATAPFTFSWTPTAVQTYTLYGKVEMTGDANAANNQTPNLSVVVQPSGTVAVTVGDPNSTTSSNSYPANFYWKNSLTQCLYMANEINAGGAITAVKYYATLLGDIPANTPLKVWMANTTATAFEGTGGWLPMDQFTLVFDGTVDLSATGAYELTLPLSTPFVYGGGNMVIMVNRPMDTAYYGSGNVWKNTATANYPNRTIYFKSDSTVADPTAPPAGTLAGNVPNTTFILNTAGFATLNGVVSANGTPVEGARVAIDGTTRFGLTNAQGQYEIAYVNPGTVNLTTTKHGYIDQATTGVVLTADQTTTQNISITQLPTVSVTGQINASDTGAGLAEATVKLEGYENYEVMTNATGAFSFTGVYASQTYTIKSTKPGYQAYNGEVVVGTTNVVVPAITLNELANPPSGVVATATPTQVDLTWNAPGDGVDVWFTHSLMEEYSDAIGTGVAAEFIVAHRYSQAQLQTFGVSGATLTKVKFMPNVAEAAYTIKVYTGGSANNAGTLVHEQVVPSVTVQEWNEVELTSSVTIPTTGELWIGYNVNTPSGYPAGCDAGPHLEGYGNMMYWQGAWTTLYTVSSDLPYNWMIKGLATGATGPTTFANTEFAPVAPRVDTKSTKDSNTIWSKASSNGLIYHAKNNYQEATPVITVPTTRALTGYNVWRTPLATMNQENTWTQLATGVTVTNYSDPTWAQVTTGQFKYVVKAVYTGGVVSNPAFSNTVFKNMTTNVTINLATADGQSPAGAVVTLTNIDGNPEHAYTATATSATVNFPSVWHGTYTIAVSKVGYQTYTQSNVSISGETYSHPLITLLVSNIGFADNFENQTSFSLTMNNWTLVDLDQSATYGISGVSWENAYAAQAFIVFAPGETSPALTSIEMLPNSTKMAACFASTTPPNNDWMISPRFTAGPNTMVKFQARSHNDTYGLERIKFGVSTNANPTPNDMTIISAGSYVDVPVAWTEFEYSLSAYNGQQVSFGINCVSNDAFVLYIDNVEVTGVNSIDDPTPVAKKTALNGNYPNPFNPVTTISYSIEKDDHVSIDVFNVKGQKVRTLVNDRLTAGSHTIQWNGTDDNGKNVSSGIYFFNMKSGKYTSTRKMILMK